jgi:hypothetical protein
MIPVKLLLLLAAHLLLTGLPGIAAALLAARRGMRGVPALLAIALAASGTVAILAFWTYYRDRLLGEAFSYFVLFGSILATGWSLWSRELDKDLLSAWARRWRSGGWDRPSCSSSAFCTGERRAPTRRSPASSRPWASSVSAWWRFAATRPRTPRLGEEERRLELSQAG